MRSVDNAITRCGLSLTVWNGSSPYGRRLSVGLLRRSSLAAFCHIKDVCCEANLQQLWRQVFCSCRSEAVELLVCDYLPSTFNNWRPCCQMATVIKHPVSDRVKRVICNFWHPGTLTLSYEAECQSAWLSKITNDRLSRSGTGCFRAVLMAAVGVKGLSPSRRRVL